MIFNIALVIFLLLNNCTAFVSKDELVVVYVNDSKQDILQQYLDLKTNKYIKRHYKFQTIDVLLVKAEFKTMLQNIWMSDRQFINNLVVEAFEKDLLTLTSGNKILQDVDFVIDTIQTQKIKDNTPDSCMSQETGEKYWGLTRICSDLIPLYNNNDSFLYNTIGKDVDIYIVDTGVNINHTTFDNGRASHGYTVKELQDAEGKEDLHGHGTHVAALAAGFQHGTAKGANIISVKVLSKKGYGNFGWLLEGLEWITTNLKTDRQSVINLSLGFKGVNGSTDFLEEIIRSIPAVFVVAAGNSKMDACLIVPAKFQNVITVASSNIFDKLSNFTNFGSCVDILAPGTNILSASIHKNGSGELKASGTSMSTGFVSGVVAQILQHQYDRSFTTFDVRNSLVKNGSHGIKSLNTTNVIVHSNCTDYMLTETTISSTFQTSTFTSCGRKQPSNLFNLLFVVYIIFQYSVFMS